jgi:hypothetical protein
MNWGDSSVNARIKTLMSYAFDKHYMTDRAVNFAKLSMFLNAFIALGKISMGIYSLSLFVCVGGFYNIGIGVAKYVMVKGHAEKDKRRNYKCVGIIILLTSASYMAYCLIMSIRNKANVSYDMIASITIATFTFTEIGLAVRGLLNTRKNANLTLAAAKRISFVTALISIALTQSALLGLSEVENAARYCGWVGLLLGGVSAMVGAQMIMKMHKERA